MSNELEDIKAVLRGYDFNGSDAVAQIEGLYSDLDSTTAKLAEAMALLRKISSFEYKGGGYYRKKGVSKGKDAEMFHGSQLGKMIEEVMGEM